MLFMPWNSISVSQIFLPDYLKAWSNRDNVQNLTVKRSAASCSHLQGLGRKTSDDSIKTLAETVKLHKAVIVWKVMSVPSASWWNQQWSIPWILPKERPKRNVKNKGNEQTAVARFGPQPQPTRAQFVVLAGEQALNKQEELKLAEQSEKYLELFMYEWLQGGKGRRLLFGQIR